MPAGIRFALLLLAVYASPIQASSLQQGKAISGSEADSAAFTFYFRPADLLLLPDYRGNDVQLQQLATTIGRLRRQDTLKDRYFRITSSLKRNSADDPQAVNTASLQGSVIKSYLHTRYRLGNVAATFGIDTCGDASDKVRLSILPLPVPAGANTAIHYSIARTTAGARQAMNRYDPVPYACCGQTTVAAESREPEAAIPSDERPGATCRCDSLNDALHELRSEVQTAKASARSYADSLYQASIRIGEPCSQAQTEYRPIIGVKTNLLYWAGFFPEMTWEQVLPNLSLEFYIAERWSVGVDGAASLRLRNGRNQKLCAFSSFGGEGRYWFRKGYVFKGFYAGAYLNGGTFDRTPRHTDDPGHTGTFVGAGLSAGYTFMFNRWIGLEIGIRGGFRHVEDDRYRHVGTEYFYRDTKYKNGVRLDGVFLNLTGRFGKYK